MTEVPCPECDREYYRSPFAAHVYCPDCGTTFHQEWQDRTREDDAEVSTWGITKEVFREMWRDSPTVTVGAPLAIVYLGAGVYVLDAGPWYYLTFMVAWWVATILERRHWNPEGDDD